MPSIAELISRGWGGYRGWNNEAAASADFAATGGAGKWDPTGPGVSSAVAQPAIPTATAIPAATTTFAQTQQAKEQDFLTRFRTAIPEARTAIESELGLPGLRQGALAAGATARGVQGQFQAIAPTQQTIAQQVGISAPRLQQRISQKTSELAPALSAASRGLAGATEALALGQETYGQRIEETLLPFQTEATVLSESLAREMTGFTTAMQSELDITLQKLRNQGALDVAEMQQLERLAQQEQEYLNQRQLVSLGNRQALINPQTGQEIASYAQGLAPKRGIGTLGDPLNLGLT